jgi:hypothetical protein
VRESRRSVQANQAPANPLCCKAFPGHGRTPAAPRGAGPDGATCAGPAGDRRRELPSERRPAWWWRVGPVNRSLAGHPDPGCCRAAVAGAFEWVGRLPWPGRRHVELATAPVSRRQCWRQARRCAAATFGSVIDDGARPVWAARQGRRGHRSLLRAGRCRRAGARRGRRRRRARCPSRRPARRPAGLSRLLAGARCACRPT